MKWKNTGNQSEGTWFPVLFMGQLPFIPQKLHFMPLKEIGENNLI
jgi:hypothetical protein